MNSERAANAGRLRSVHMVSEHASPLALLGGVDAGGQNVHVAEVARGLAALGVRVVVHTRRDDPALPRRVRFGPGVVVDHVDAGPATPIPKDDLLPYMSQFARDLARVWRANRPDVVFSHFWMSGLAALGAAAPLGIPVAHTFHALGIVKRRHQGAHDPSPPERIELERAIARRAYRIVATCSDEVRELVAMGIDEKRVRVVPCGVDLSRFSPFGAARRPDRARPRVLSLSRLVERKGVANVVEAIAQVPDAELIVAGGPPAALIDDEPEAARIVALAERLGVADRVHLLGAVRREDVPDLIRSVDVVACCPWYEPFGIVAVEAMACGVPVVASRVGGLAETVQHGKTGLHVAPRAPHEIAAAIATLIADDSLRRRMGRAGVHRARHYGWPQVTDAVYDVLAELGGVTTFDTFAPAAAVNR